MKERILVTIDFLRLPRARKDKYIVKWLEGVEKHISFDGAIMFQLEGSWQEIFSDLTTILELNSEYVQNVKVKLYEDKRAIQY